MKSWFIVGLMLLGISVSVQAKDDIKRFPIAPALALKDTRESLDPAVRLSFASNPGGRVIGSYNSNKRSNGAGKDDATACNVAFLSAAIALQKKAVHEGGNAVVNIHSFYKGKKFNSSKEYECAVGRVMSAVTLRGTVVKR